MAILTDINIIKNKDHQITEAFSGIIDVGEVVYQSGSRVPSEGFCQHEGKELCYIAKGEVTFGTEEGNIVVKEGEFHYLNKAVPHFCRNDGDSECRLLYILIKS
jgi:quercetin dioxygenase-like cupin family protein